MNTNAATKTAPESDRILTDLLDQIDSAAGAAALATDLAYPDGATRELEEAHRLLRLAANSVAQARRHVRLSIG